jgi:hypothetical protein
MNMVLYCLALVYIRVNHIYYYDTVYKTRHYYGTLLCKPHVLLLITLICSILDSFL